MTYDVGVEDFKKLLQARLSKQKMNKQSIGAFVISLLRKQAQYPEEFGGYLKQQIAFVKLDAREDKTQFFLNKKKLLEDLNKELASFGYEVKVRDIRIRS